MQNKQMIKSKQKSIIAFCLAIVLLFGCTIAYFTDHIHESTSGTAGTVDISFDSDVNLLNTEGQDILNPGDIRNVSFTIDNEGNKSVDTEVVVTLTSSVPMSNNKSNPGGKSVAPFYTDVPDPDGPDNGIYNMQVYSSEYELYWADDVVAVEGQGYYPKTDVYPAQTRYINGVQNQIVYVLDGGVLSGNSELDEQEIEYKLIDESLEGPALSDYSILYENDEYYVDFGDISHSFEGATNVVFAEVMIQLECDYNASALVMPNYKLADNGERIPIEYLVFYAADEHGVGIPDGVSDLYVGSNTKGFAFLDAQRTAICTIEELADFLGVNIHTYDDLDELVSGNTNASASVISEHEYNIGYRKGNLCEMR